MIDALQAETRTFGELHGNGRRYVVPPFQRDYAWTEDEWRDLWEDIGQLRGSAQARHYLGALVVQPEGDGEILKVVDGQQRLTTLAILSLAIIDRLLTLADDGTEPEQNRARADELRRALVSTRDPSSLKQESRLRLNETDDGFFQSYLVELKTPPFPSKLKGSNARLWQAFIYFKARLTETFAGAGGEEIAAFLSHVVARGLLFILIRVVDDRAAYTVFETLNARGVGLGPADLVKNFVFAKAALSRVDLARAQDQWARIIETVPLDGIEDLLFHYLNGLETATRRPRLFDAVKSRILTREDAFAFLDQIEEAAVIYAALDEPQDQLWDPEQTRWLRVLKLLRVEQYKSLVLAARSWHTANSDELTKLLRLCAVLSMRANIIVSTNTADVQRAYQRAALAVTQRKLTRTREVFKELESLYPPDPDFEAAFATKALHASAARRPLVKYILIELERAGGGESDDWEASPATIEHILPLNPGPGWEHVTAEERASFTQRLGNLALLEASINRGVGGLAFHEKRPRLATSRFVTTAEIDADFWGPSAIQERQRKMARVASSIWRYDASPKGVV